MPVLFVDPDLLDLLPGYIDARKQDLPAIQAWLQAGVYDAIANLGHRWRGSGASYGLRELSLAGEQLQAAAERQDGATIAAVLTRVQAYLNDLELRPRQGG